MKSKCSFTLKALTALVLAVVMLFGTMSTGIAAVKDLAQSGWSFTTNCVYWVDSDTWFGSTGAQIRTGGTLKIHFWGSWGTYDVTFYHIPNTGVYQWDFSAGDKQTTLSGAQFQGNGNYGSNIYADITSQSVFYGNGNSADTTVSHVNGIVDVSTMVSFDQGSTFSAVKNNYIYTSATTKNITTGTGGTTTDSKNTKDNGTNGKIEVYPAYGAEYTLTASNSNVTFYGFTNTKECPGASTNTYTYTGTSLEHAGTRKAANTWYAYYIADTYTITFNNNGGSLSTPPTYYAYGKGIASLPTPTRTGYTFDGWYEEPDFSDSKKTSIAANSTGNKIYYAKWSEDMHDVTVKTSTGGQISLDGSVYTTEDQTASAGISTTDDIYSAADPGYRFNGWTASAGTVTITDSTAASTSINATADSQYVTATFAENLSSLTLTNNTANGTVTETAGTGSVGVATHSTVDISADTGYGIDHITVSGNIVAKFDIDNDGDLDDFGNGTSIDLSSSMPDSAELQVYGDGTNGGSGTLTVYYTATNKTITIYKALKTTSAGEFTTASSGPAGIIVIKQGDTTKTTIDTSTISDYGVIQRGANASAEVTPVAAEGYVFDGWYDELGTKVTDTNSSHSVYLDDTTLCFNAITDNHTYYARFNRGANATFLDYDDTELQAATWVYYDDTASCADASRTGYIFDGWNTNKAAADGATITNHVIADTTYYAIYDIRTYTVTYRALGMDNATEGYNVALTAPTAVESNVSGTAGTMDYGDSLALSNNNTNAAYEFVGWHIVNDANASDSATLAANTTFSDVSPLVLSSETANNCYHVYALYKKIYYLTLYNTYINENGSFIFEAAPPKKVTATAAGSNAVTTFKYVKSTTSAGQDATVTSGDFNEGNQLKVLAGDRIVMTYSSLAASDIIGAVLYRDAPKRYTTQEQDDNLYLNGVAQDPLDKVDGKYPNGDDTWDYTYTSDSCLYASGSYYTPAIAATIAAQTYAAEVDQTAHTVSFTADKDYRNVDIELASKKRVFFSDSDKITVKSTHVSNYYDIGEQLTNGGTYDTVLAVKAKGSADMINTITLDDIDVYYADKDGKPYGEALEWSDTALIAKGISAGESISSSGASDSSEYVYFYTTAPGAGMPSSDLYIDLKVTNSYNVYLDSKIQADEIEDKTKFCQVADVTVNTTGGTKLLGQYYDVTGVQGPTVVSAGDQVRLSYAFTGSWGSYYMFIGWYKGTADGPDFDNGFISTSNNISFKPEKNVYVYAVGTRDLYINGSSYITGSTYGNWNEISGTKTNYKMSFDPKKMVYYFTITESIFNATNPSHPEYTKGATGQDNTTKHYYWSDTNNMGNSFFIILDTATGMDSNNKQVWKSITSFDYTDSSSGVHFGKAYPNGYGAENWENKQKDGCAFIEFDPEDHAGYVAPLTIYFDPHASAGGAQNERLYVKATPIYGHIYASNGYTNIDSYSDTGKHDKQDTTGAYNAADAGIDVTVEPVYNGSVVASGDANYFDITLNGDGWNPRDSSTYDYEGHVNDYTVEKRNATVRITKTLSSATYKVSYFNVYNTATDKVKAYAATAGASNTYYVDLTMKDDQGLYVVPIIEYNDYHAAADDGKPEAITILFDSEQLKSKEWGDFVACYAWYTDNSTAYGEYPGQMMVPSDDGKSWSATFPSTKPGDSTKSLAGITFTNYYDSYRTWLGETNVYQGTQIITGNYNSIATRAGGVDYSKTNFKAQTYDYREPIAFFKNKTGDDELTIKFGIKSGGADLITWTHTDLVSNNILTYKTAQPSWSDIEFEYLYDSTGVNYCDLSGIPIEGEPAPSFYICAKGEAAYVDNSLARIFWSGTSYQTPEDAFNDEDDPKTGYGTAVTYDNYKYYTANEINMSHAVQWYIYDASGNYITNILSAAFADKENTAEPMQTKVSKVLKDLGYPVDGRSVMIAYDMPRYCYSEEDDIPNTGSSFDAYRFAGQWYQKNDIDLINLNAEVGIINPDSSYTFANSDSAGYGSVTVSLNTAGFSHPQSNFANVTDKAAAFTTISDKDLRGVTFNASSTNFVGWYYKDSEGNMQEADYASATGFRPAYSDDTTYYAMYKASAFYRYNYAGRERSVSYTVLAGDMTADEMAAGNKVATTRDDTLNPSYVPGSGVITRFKKTINFSGATTKTATDEYILDISGAVWTPETFTLTAYYPDAKNGASVAHEYTGIAYNTAVDLTERASGAVTNNAPDNQVFKGWYDASTGGNLISSQPNFGMIVVKATTIYAQYDTAPHSGTDAWEVFIDENQVTHEMYNNENSGMYYNDTIVRVRQNNGSSVLPEGAEVGILVLNNGRAASSLYASTEKLATFANKLPNGATGRVGSAGITVTKVVASKVTRFGRADLAVRSEYASTVGTTYRVYAYVKIGDTYYFTLDAATVTGTYAAFNA